MGLLPLYRTVGRLRRDGSDGSNLSSASVLSIFCFQRPETHALFTPPLPYAHALSSLASALLLANTSIACLLLTFLTLPLCAASPILMLSAY